MMYMKRGIDRFICFLIVVTFSCSGWSMSLCDYRSPESTISDVGMSFLYRYLDGSAEQDINRGQLKLDYNRLFNSPNFGYELSLNNSMTISELNLYSFSAMAAEVYNTIFPLKHHISALLAPKLRALPAPNTKLLDCS